MSRLEDPTARVRILEAAARLFYERGVNGVGMSEIVAEAGTGRNALYRHFPGKQQLILAVLKEFAERNDKSLTEALTGLPPDKALVAMSRHVAALVSGPGYRGCPLRNYLRESRDTQAPAGRFALARVHSQRRRIGDLATRLEVDESEQVALRIWLVLEGVYATTPFADRAAVADQAVRYVQEIVTGDPAPFDDGSAIRSG